MILNVFIFDPLVNNLLSSLSKESQFKSTRLLNNYYFNMRISIIIKPNFVVIHLKAHNYTCNSACKFKTMYIVDSKLFKN